MKMELMERRQAVHANKIQALMLMITVMHAQKFIFVVQGETCSIYPEFCTYEKSPILPVVTENGMLFPNKVNIS